jgi:hypothetical protein
VDDARPRGQPRPAFQFGGDIGFAAEQQEAEAGVAFGGDIGGCNRFGGTGIACWAQLS